MVRIATAHAHLQAHADHVTAMLEVQGADLDRLRESEQNLRAFFLFFVGQRFLCIRIGTRVLFLNFPTSTTTFNTNAYMHTCIYPCAHHTTVTKVKEQEAAAARAQADASRAIAENADLKAKVSNDAAAAEVCPAFCTEALQDL